MKKKSEELSIKVQFKDAVEYIKESMMHIYFVIAVFILGTLIGFFYPENFTFLNKLIEDLIGKTIGLNPLELIFFIMQNNALSALFGLTGGIFLGIFPVMSGLLNGIVLGYVLAISAGSIGLGEFWRLLPHGIFELPAIFIALGVGVKLGGFIFSKEKLGELKRRFYGGINVFLIIVLPLLIIAAVIEGLLIFLI
jgi:stage II sporulation protein M